jgi:uncharacterized membrane protein YozB (DUF420 family)
VDLESPGFLHLGAELGADIALVSMLFLGIVLTFGVVLAVRGKFELHRYVQTFAVFFSTIVVFYLMVLRLFDPDEEDVEAGMALFEIVLLTHILIGSAAVLLGVFIALRANSLVPKILQFRNYKTPMRVSYALYMVAILLGVWVYVAMPDRVGA